MAVQRYGRVIGLKLDRVEEYRRLHTAVWPEVLATIHRCGIRNYSIYYRDGLLFSYFEYVGDSFEADMALMAADAKTREWWQLTNPCQQPVASALDSEWWAELEEMFHCE